MPNHTNETLSGSVPTGTLGYGLDPVGNRTNRTARLGLLAQNPTYNSDDWISGDAYDSDGNTRTNGSSQPYFYDYEDRLTNFNNAQVLIWYNADGQRVKKETSTGTTLYLVDSHNPSGYAQVLEELTVSGPTTNLARAYTYGLAIISQRQPGVTTNFYGTDGHGSVRLLLNPAGVATDTYTYDAYGNLITSSATTSNNYLYCGEQWDPDLGMYYLRARYLNPNTGRFWTMDTVDGRGREPLSLHKYLYVQSNPVNHQDPNGKDLADIGAILGSYMASFAITVGIPALSKGALSGSLSVDKGAEPGFQFRVEIAIVILGNTPRGKTLLDIAKHFTNPIVIKPGGDDDDLPSTIYDAEKGITFMTLSPHNLTGVHYIHEEGERMPASDEFPPESLVGMALIIGHEMGHAVFPGDQPAGMDPSPNDAGIPNPRGLNVKFNENPIRKQLGITPLRRHYDGVELPPELIE